MGTFPISADVKLIYSVFGLFLEANHPIPGLTPLETAPPLDSVQVHLGNSSGAATVPEGPEKIRYTSAYLDPSGEPALRLWEIADGAFLHLYYSDGMEFWLDRDGNNVWGRWPESASIEDAATYFLGPVLGLLLRLRGVTCLHASAVVIDGGVVAFVGCAGAGKSTTAAALARRGCSVLSDDIVALSESRGIFQVMPAYPYLSLWPESVEMLYGSADFLPRFIGTWEKRYLADGNGGVRFAAGAAQLRALYILGERSADPAPYIEAISAQSAFITLVANTYATSGLDSRMRAMEFEVLGRLVSAVPIQMIHSHQDPLRIDDLCRLVCKDLAEIPSQITRADEKK